MALRLWIVRALLVIPTTIALHSAYAPITSVKADTCYACGGGYCFQPTDQGWYSCGDSGDGTYCGVSGKGCNPNPE